MVSFLDLIQQDDFRNYVASRLDDTVRESHYSFARRFPPLFKYRALSKYAVDDILNGRVMTTRIGDFNDLFEGAMHRFGTVEERTRAAEEKWDELKKLSIATGMREGLFKHDDYVQTYADHFKTDSRLKFRILDYLGTYVCCLSSKFDSTLMWAHYADSNMGICVEYDFNSSATKHLLRDMVFRVAYSKEPVNLSDLLNDEKSEVYQYPVDAAVLCAALNKADVWSYENEWRVVLVLTSATKKRRRIPINVPAPTSISFGYHFLKPFFCYDFYNKHEVEAAEAKITEARRLLNYIRDKKIATHIMVPSVGEYRLLRKSVYVDDLIGLMDEYFRENKPQDMRYYYVIHDDLMDIVEKENGSL